MTLNIIECKKKRIDVGDPKILRFCSCTFGYPQKVKGIKKKKRTTCQKNLHSLTDCNLGYLDQE